MTAKSRKKMEIDGIFKSTLDDLSWMDKKEASLISIRFATCVSRHNCNKNTWPLGANNDNALYISCTVSVVNTYMQRGHVSRYESELERTDLRRNTAMWPSSDRWMVIGCLPQRSWKCRRGSTPEIFDFTISHSHFWALLTLISLDISISWIVFP